MYFRYGSASLESTSPPKRSIGSNKICLLVWLNHNLRIYEKKTSRRIDPVKIKYFSSLKKMSAKKQNKKTTTEHQIHRFNPIIPLNYSYFLSFLNAFIEYYASYSKLLTYIRNCVVNEHCTILQLHTLHNTNIKPQSYMKFVNISFK